WTAGVNPAARSAYTRRAAGFTPAAPTQTPPVPNPPVRYTRGPIPLGRPRMATFYLLPPRACLEQSLGELLVRLLPGLPAPAAPAHKPTPHARPVPRRPVEGTRPRPRGRGLHPAGEPTPPGPARRRPGGRTGRRGAAGPRVRPPPAGARTRGRGARPPGR